MIVPGGLSPILILIFIVPLVVGFAAQAWVKRAYRENSMERSTYGYTGAQVARRVLDASGLTGVPVHATPGELSDHYDPRDKTVHLSESTYASPTVAAAAIAAHEVGHAVQHAKGNALLRLRTSMAPATMAASRFWFVPLMLGFVTGAAGFIWLAVAIFAVTVAFHLVTLPVEVDASRRAMGQLHQLGLVSDDERSGARRVLTAAASTYLVAALASVATLVYYVLVARR
jgi:Zn-dependent membrane protease YugP